MRGLMLVLLVVGMATMIGCFSWSRQTYDARGDGPPRVRHSSWSAGILPARSPVEAAQADAIGTGVKYGYGGGYYGVYGGAGAGAFGWAPVQYSWFRPIGVPRNRIIFARNLTDSFVRMRVNGQIVPGFLEPRAESYLVSNHPTSHRLEFCAHEAPGGAPTGYWSVRIGTSTDRSGYYEVNEHKLDRGRCPF